MYANPHTKLKSPDTFTKECKHVAVIGAGLSGITTAKNLLDEGHEVVTYEKEEHYCGIWKKNRENGGVWEKLHTNSSKMVTMFSDYPMPEHYPDYPSSQQVVEYLRSYAEHFGVDKTVRTNQKVEMVAKENGKWKVVTPDGTEYYDAVAICSGVHQTARIPDIKGIETFKGDTVHSHYFTSANGYEGKNVLTVGSAESAQEIASLLADITKNLYVSSRNGVGLLPKFLEGVPMDLFLPRFKYALPKAIVDLMDAISFNIKLGGKDGHPIDVWKLKQGNMTRTYVVKQSQSLTKIYEKRLTPKGGIDHISGNTVHFEDGSCHEVDSIIYCTGFKGSFPFLGDDFMINFEKMYLSSFDPDMDGLAFAGFARPNFGSLFSMSEMQARILAKKLSGEIEFPSKDVMKKVAMSDFKKRMNWQRMAHKRLPHIHSYPEYMFHMSKVLGCKPGLFRYLFTDPKLFLPMLTNTLPVMFRVEGPNKWDGAKKCLLDYFAEVKKKYIFRKYQVAVSFIWVLIIIGITVAVGSGLTFFYNLIA